jgi:glycosyltransferase involved in cell wall biosynthesis
MIADPQYLKHVRLASRTAQRLAWGYARLYYDRCDLITSPTEALRKELVSHGFQSPIAVVSNGIDARAFDNSGWRAARAKYCPDGKLLVYVGRIAHEKNIPYLIDCFARVHKKMPQARLLLVGDGPQMAQERARVRALGLDHAIHFAGSIPHEKFLRSGILKAADLFVTASTTEVQCMTILEAMTCGTPAVGIRSRGVGDIIINGRNGLLVRNHDKTAFATAVVRILKNDQLRSRLEANAERDSRAYLMSNIVKVWERTYEGLLSVNRSAAEVPRDARGKKRKA